MCKHKYLPPCQILLEKFPSLEVLSYYKLAMSLGGNYEHLIHM